MAESEDSMSDNPIRLSADERNANRGTEWGRDLLAASIRKYGGGRGIVVDRNGKIIAGNKTAEAALAAGLDILEVHTDGDRLIVVVRDDLELDANGKARELAYWDNRVSEANLSWDWDQIRRDWDAGDPSLRQTLESAWSREQRKAAWDVWAEDDQPKGRSVPNDALRGTPRGYEPPVDDSTPSESERIADRREQYVKITTCPACSHRFVPDRVELIERKQFEVQQGYSPVEPLDGIDDA
jgi:hypothetical protein